MTMRYAIGICLILALLAVGYVRIRQPYPEKHTFVLEVERPDEAMAPALAPSVSVRPFTISPRYESGQLVYRRDELAYTTDYYNVFLISPERMIAEQAREWLADTGLFEHVLPASSHIVPMYILEGNVVRLYGDLREPKHPEAVLAIEFILIRNGLSSDVALQKSVLKRVEVEDSTAESIVKGLADALGRTLQEFEANLRQSLRDSN